MLLPTLANPVSPVALSSRLTSGLYLPLAIAVKTTVNAIAIALHLLARQSLSNRPRLSAIALATTCDLSNMATVDVNSALLQAASSGDVTAIRDALKAGAAVDTRDATQRTPLLIAALADHVDAAKALLEAGASPDAMDDMRQTPWLVTGVTGSVPMLEAILPYNPDMKLRNRYGGISVIPASERGHVDYVRRVVKTGIDVNHVNNLGWTALLEAVILGDGGQKHQEIVDILLANGADAGIRDKDGVSPLQHAKSGGYAEIVSSLEKAGASE